MASQGPDLDKLRKLEALMADRAATAGEKAAASAAATRVRSLWQRMRAEHDRAEARKGLMYLLGRAWRSGRRGDVAKGGADAMYVMGRAWRKMTSKR
jgi:hypothetical protein